MCGLIAVGVVHKFGRHKSAGVREHADGTAVDVPARERSVRWAAEMLGVNEALAVPRPALIPMSSMVRDHTLAQRGGMVGQLGARIIRATPHAFPSLTPEKTGPGRWGDADAFFSAAAAANLSVIATLAPWDTPEEGVAAGGYVPKDMAAWRTWVGLVVERYDADGTDDFDGDTPDITWEVDNEPDLHHARPPRGLEGQPPPKDYETAEEYARVFVATFGAIRRADAAANVLLGGIYQIGSPTGQAYLKTVLANGGMNADGLSVHVYFDADNLAPIHHDMQVARDLAPDMPVWVTETGVPATADPTRARTRDATWVTPEWQARMVPAIVGAFLSEGAEAVLWHPLVEAPDAGQSPGAFRRNALFVGVEGGIGDATPRPAAAVYSRLATILAKVETGSMHEIEAEGGRLLQTNRGWLVFEGTVRPPEGTETMLDLLTGRVGAVPSEVAAPAWLQR